MGFSRQEYWSGLPFPSLGGLPDPGMEPVSPALAGVFFTTEPPGKSMRHTALQKKKNSICCVPALKFAWTSCSLSGNPAYDFPFWAYIRAKSVDVGAGHASLETALPLSGDRAAGQASNGWELLFPQEQVQMTAPASCVLFKTT